MGEVLGREREVCSVVAKSRRVGREREACSVVVKWREELGREREGCSVVVKWMVVGDGKERVLGEGR